MVDGNKYLGIHCKILHKSRSILSRDVSTWFLSLSNTSFLGSNPSDSHTVHVHLFDPRKNVARIKNWMCVTHMKISQNKTVCVQDKICKNLRLLYMYMLHVCSGLWQTHPWIGLCTVHATSPLLHAFCAAHNFIIYGTVPWPQPFML